MRQIFCFPKIFSIIIFLILTSSCTHHYIKDSEIQGLKRKENAVIISGCRYYHSTNSFFSTNGEKNCTAIWKNEKGEKIEFSGAIDIMFVKPGNYEFISYKSETGKYKLYPGAVSVFKKVNVKAGQVKYIGTLKVDAQKSFAVYDSMKFIVETQKVKQILQESAKYLLSRLVVEPASFSERAQKFKKLFSKKVIK